MYYGLKFKVKTGYSVYEQTEFKKNHIHIYNYYLKDNILSEI